MILSTGIMEGAVVSCFSKGVHVVPPSAIIEVISALFEVTEGEVIVNPSVDFEGTNVRFFVINRFR